VILRTRAIDANRKLDERPQRALTPTTWPGSGGIAVGVHTTQFAIMTRKSVCSRRCWPLAREVAQGGDESPSRASAGKESRVAEAETGTFAQLRSPALLSLAGSVGECSELLDHDAHRLHHSCVGCIFSCGGRARSAVLIMAPICGDSGVVAIKIAPFNRYQTLTWFAAVVESGTAPAKLPSIRQ